jgi:hypothetical protein
MKTSQMLISEKLVKYNVIYFCRKEKIGSFLCADMGRCQKI